MELAKKLNLLAPNINKVVKGELKTTGGYEIKLEKEIYKANAKEWSSIKEENNIVDKLKGQPSVNRILHEKVNDILGKKCCDCKTWQPLTNYNKSDTHWDATSNIKLDIS